MGWSDEDIANVNAITGDAYGLAVASGLNENAYNALKENYSETDLNNMLEEYGLNAGDWAGLKAAIEGDTAATQENTTSNETNTESNTANTEANVANTEASVANTEVTSVAAENTSAITDNRDRTDTPFDKPGTQYYGAIRPDTSKPGPDEEPKVDTPEFDPATGQIKGIVEEIADNVATQTDLAEDAANESTSANGTKSKGTTTDENGNPVDENGNQIEMPYAESTPAPTPSGGGGGGSDGGGGGSGGGGGGSGGGGGGSGGGTTNGAQHAFEKIGESHGVDIYRDNTTGREFGVKTHEDGTTDI